MVLADIPRDFEHAIQRSSDVAPNAHFDESQEQLPEQRDNGKHLRLPEGDMDIFGPVRRMRRRSM